MQIGSVLTPWPSWLIAAHSLDERAPPEAVRAFLSSLSGYVRSFDSQEKRAVEDVEFIKQRFSYQEEDIKVHPGSTFDFSRVVCACADLFLQGMAFNSKISI